LAIRPRLRNLPIIPLPSGFATARSPYSTGKFTNLLNWWPSPTDVGAIEVVPGYSKVNATALSASKTVVSLGFGENSSLARKRFVVFDGTVSILTTAGVSSNIKTGLTSGKQMGIATYDDNVFFFNGVDAPFKYDFSSDTTGAVSAMGLTQPSVGSSTSALTGSGGNVKGNVKYYVSYVSTTTEGALSDSFGAIDAGDGNKIALATLPTGGGGVTARRLYRTSFDGEVPLYLSTIEDNTTTTFTDNVHDRDLGAPAKMRGYPPQSTWKFPIVHFNRLWAGDEDSLYFSDLGEPESWFATNRMRIWQNDGDHITGLDRDSEGIFIFKEQHLYKAVGKDPEAEIFTIIELTPSDANTRSLGTPSHWSKVATEFGIIFYSQLGFYLIRSGTQVINISQDIQDELRADMTVGSEDKIVCTYLPELKLFLASVPTSSSTTNNRTYGYLVDRRAWFKMDVGFSALQIIESGADAAGPGALAIWGGKPATNAFVYKLFDSSTNTFDGTAISSVATLPVIMGSFPGGVSRFLSFDVIGEAQTGTISIEYLLDRQSSGTTVSFSTANTGFGSYQKTVNIGQQARELEVSFKTSADQTPSKVYGLTVQTQNMGRKSV